MADKYSNMNSRNQKNNQPVTLTPPAARRTKYLPGTEPREQSFTDAYNSNSDKNAVDKPSFYQNDKRTISDVHNKVSELFASAGVDAKSKISARFAQTEMMLNTVQASASEVVAKCHANVSEPRLENNAEKAKRVALADKINDITGVGYSEKEALSNAVTSMYNKMEVYAFGENRRYKDGRRDYITIVNGDEAYLMKLDKPISREYYAKICPVHDATRFDPYVKPYGDDGITLNQTSISVKLGENKISGELCVDGKAFIDVDDSTLQREKEYEVSRSGPDTPPPASPVPVKTLAPNIPEIEEPEVEPDTKHSQPDYSQPDIICASDNTKQTPKPAVRQNPYARFKADLDMSYANNSLEDDGPDL